MSPRRFMHRGCGRPRRSGREFVQNFQLVRLQLGDIAPHLPLTGLELGCELVNTLAYRCETEREVFKLG